MNCPPFFYRIFAPQNNTMNKYIQEIQSASADLSTQIVNHPAYKSINSIEGIQTFMEHHIYAVWDFMSLLKALQINLTCTQIPWMPTGSPQVRFLINEIVCGEESDIAYKKDGRMSHFELYMEAMEQSGASRIGIDQLLEKIIAGNTVESAIENTDIPESAKAFLRFTFEVIATNKPHIIAAVFTFGREDLIPNMFHTIVGDINERFPNQVAVFKYYLDRHIEVDGDHHSHLALEMVSELCGDDDQKWQEAKEYTLRALQSRIELWNGVQEANSIQEQKISTSDTLHLNS
jgi:pyrroloquinoline quinone (PQQ) biosynthesis protein C